ncbi:MAG: hypothetical protein HY706_16450 [Candidatus Hydrogenedentes bacterium]|nr:hypothetical protein [Candidatus Hydrogenedentota bacterium]
MSTRDPRPDSGMSLLEVLAYVALLSILINLAAGIFVSTLRISKTGTRRLDTLQVMRTLGQDFADAAHRAYAVTPQLGQYTTNDQSVILALGPDDAPSNTKKFVVFGPIAAPNRMSRVMVREEAGQISLESCTTYAMELDTIEFSFVPPDSSEARTASMEITPKAQNAKLGSATPLKFVGTLRGLEVR